MWGGNYFVQATGKSTRRGPTRQPHHGPVAVSPDGPHGHSGVHGRGVERPVQHVYVPTTSGVPGVIRARRYTAVDGQPEYLTVYASSSARTSEE